MGQRLVVIIQTDKKDIMKVYYHWSGYTISALERVAPLVKICKESKGVDNVRLNIIKYLEAFNGGIVEKDAEYIKKKYPGTKFSPASNRNEGLVACSQSEMEYLQNFSEADIIINLDNKLIYNEVLWELETKEEIESLFGISKDTKIPTIERNVSCFSFNELEEVTELLADLNHPVFKDEYENYYATIE